MPGKMQADPRAKKAETSFAVEARGWNPRTPNDRQVDVQVKLGREFMASYRNTFRALPK